MLRAAVEAADPGRLVDAAIHRGALDALPHQPLFVVAAGKAGWPMARAFAQHAGRPIAGGLVAGPRAGQGSEDPRFAWFDAPHPFPDAVSESAGRRALALAAQARKTGSLVVLLSGGASSMLAVPADGIALEDKVAIARALMRAGVTIAELNCVRKHLSAIKGGRLALAAGQTVTLAISDVHGPVEDDPAVIASGPTVADASTCEQALAVLSRAGLSGTTPRSVIAHLERNETPKPGESRLAGPEYVVIGNRHTAMAAAARTARELGYSVRTVERATSGEARDAGVAFVADALSDRGWARVGDRRGGSPFCVIATGETTVRVRGEGRGGRNQEFVLAALPLLDAFGKSDGAVAAVASAGTDGIDGPTDAAGAVADMMSATRARRAGLDCQAALTANDAYSFFQPLGDLIVWGPTGTNVGDLHVCLIRQP